MSSRQFARFTRDASARYRVCAADLLGVGNTPMPAEGYSLAREAEALLALIESRASNASAASRGALVYAHSFGGLVALEAALLAPDRFAKLALFEPVIVGLASSHGSAEARAEVRAIDALMAIDTSDGYARWIEGFIDWWNSPGFYRTLPAPTREQYRSTAREAHRQASVVRDATVTLERLRALKVSTLWMVGDRSPCAARESAALAAASVAGARIERVEGAGHMGPLTHSVLVNERVLRFFDER